MVFQGIPACAGMTKDMVLMGAFMPKYIGF
jgi:hypothetical protein